MENETNPVAEAPPANEQDSAQDQDAGGKEAPEPED